MNAALFSLRGTLWAEGTDAVATEGWAGVGGQVLMPGYGLQWVSP